MDASSATRTVSVTRMNAGDHACLGFDDDEDRWELRAAYTDIGLSRGEQVMLFTDPATTPAVAAEQLRIRGFPVEAALCEGQLAVVNEVPGYDPDSGFDPVERARTWVELTEQARHKGFSGLRVVGDMAWAAEPGVDHDLLVSYETDLSPLFAEIGFTAICEYDRRKFDDALLDRIRRAHPKKVLHRLGALEVTRTGGELRIAGDADLCTREEFATALTHALTGPGRPGALDLSELCFIDVHSAALLVRLARGLPRDQRITVRVRPAQSKVIRLCRAAEVPQLVLAEG
ncbi:MEDS domain-containing protein [Streptomyces sp. NBC_01381]|uniref:MEDS domain-containing protein n=1 Tax=Streptomyces sp. NBC_01381 TaxID=2903845 RepID=UPI00225AFB98|nr:MEDS domain-containing protein [Streptomyces sp. NBC_01381]MCX4670602.1 MEDS domain-containing protein [Streptomyces sp. NBC_01381]